MDWAGACLPVSYSILQNHIGVGMDSSSRWQSDLLPVLFLHFLAVRTWVRYSVSLCWSFNSVRWKDC